jgi:pimeloyl-ACP methyl ester carboxylesterase
MSRRFGGRLRRLSRGQHEQPGPAERQRHRPVSRWPAYVRRAASTKVLVHGAFADASSWSRLYAELASDGLMIKAPPNPLRGVTAGDVDYTKCVIEQIDGPVLLVGHSYGGAVITASGVADNVVGLVVYVAAFAPDEGEDLGTLQSKFPRLSPARTSNPLRCLTEAPSSPSTPAGSTRRSAPTCPTLRPRSRRSPNAPSPESPSAKRHPPRPGGPARRGLSCRPLTVRSIPTCTAFPATGWGPRSPSWKEPPTW